MFAARGGGVDPILKRSSAANLYFFMGCYYGKGGLYEDAVSCFREAQRLKPRDKDFEIRYKMFENHLGKLRF